MCAVLITGGAGYIGSHVNKMLNARGVETVVLDSLVTGHADFLRWGRFVKGDLRDPSALERAFAGPRIHAVLHFASFIAVGESVADPNKYYHNNVAATLNLLDAMVRHEVPGLVFSSSASVYGEPEQELLDEAHPMRPLSPYARSKAMVEQMLADYHRAHGLASCRLRYFNAAGADPDGELGERHEPETHLIPLVLHTALGLRSHISIFGTDYPTPDGTCVRDYIHVHDLAQAHVLALDWLDRGETRAFNLGNGNGHSVREVVDAAREVTGRDIPVQEAARRPGDSPVLVASSKRARTELGWRPAHGDLESIIRSAWDWHRKDCRAPVRS
ncbi:UDP-glucose 4-epimerase [Paucidesulfovibrio gracilis DSM 16080]|uniref:UDP-glucose 4-epimerase n=1 Tax=Paucidesulfovibrio gracilis DSM 16080 TaxID=1121449 RepID=A0A1T4X799_9BACT|nr:UDP-glucose 4-epimerase GalE [Paucidesulfovibrio gracilis]SKA85319.1 UDP-glucose 4-epimerase [Paucidesulfovibrio gracilis DSM 16080]